MYEKPGCRRPLIRLKHADLVRFGNNGQETSTQQETGGSMKRVWQLLTLALGFVAGTTALAVEDGLGTNHVRTLKVYNGILLGGETITSWEDVSGSTLTNNSIATGMIQNGAVTADKIGAAVAGAGLTGGAGSALAVGQGDGISVGADAVAVDSTVIRNTGNQTVSGIKTFDGTVIVPAPSADTHASTKKYVDDKLSSSVASGSASNQTLRWTGTVWTNTAGLTVDGSSNVAVGGTLGVTGISTLSATTTSTTKDTGALVVEGGVGVEENLNVGGNIAATGNIGASGNLTTTGDLSVNGNTTLGNAGTDTITFTGKAASSLNMDNTYTVTGLAAPSADADAATKLYVDSAINGLSWKAPVVASTDGNINLGATLDGVVIDSVVTLAVGDRLLVRAQSTASQNGIYVVNAGVATRATDLDATAELAGAAVFVRGGTARAGTAWVCTTPGITLGSATLTFTQFASPGTYTAGDGLNLAGLEFSVDAADITGAGLEVNGSDIRIAAAAAGAGLTGGAGSALAVGAGDGISVAADAVAVDSTVIRTTGAQSIADVKTFTSSPVVPTPTTDMQASTKKYVDDKLSSSVSSGASTNETLRWTGTTWTNTAGLTIDASSNVIVAASTQSTTKDTGALIVEGGVGVEKNLYVGGAAGVTGNITVGGTAGITGITTLSASTASTDKDTGALVVEGGVGVEGAINAGGAIAAVGNLSAGGNITATGDISANGNTTLGNAGTDTITFTAKAASDLNMNTSYKVTGLAAPTAAADAATKLYVDSAINGLSWKDAVKVATTASGTLSSSFANGQTVDGIALVTGDRILIKNQSSPVVNGVYVVQASGAPVRAEDMNASDELAGAAVFVAQGTANNGTAWVCTTPLAAIGTEDLTFTQFASPGTYSAGDGMDLAGLVFSAKPADFAGTGLEVNSGDLRIAAAAAGDGLTGGGGSALAVNTSVVRTTGAQSIADVKTFTSSPVVPTPTTDMQASTKKYVDDKLNSSVASGSASNDTLRWTGTVWTNTAGLTVDGSSNVAVGGTLGVTGITTLSATTTSTTKDNGALVVQGGVGVEENLNVGGAVKVASTTASTDKDSGALVLEGGLGLEGAINAGGNIDGAGTLTIDGNTTLGDAVATDTVTINAKTTLGGSVVLTPSSLLDIAVTGITATHIQLPYLQVRGNGGPIDVTANPQIAAGTAGQMVTLQGMSDTNTLKLDDGTGLALSEGVAFTLKAGHLIQFIYDGSVWRETFRTVPAP